MKLYTDINFYILKHIYLKLLYRSFTWNSHFISLMIIFCKGKQLQMSIEISIIGRKLGKCQKSIMRKILEHNRFKPITIIASYNGCSAQLFFFTTQVAKQQ